MINRSCRKRQRNSTFGKSTSKTSTVDIPPAYPRKQLSWTSYKISLSTEVKTWSTRVYVQTEAKPVSRQTEQSNRTKQYDKIFLTKAWKLLAKRPLNISFNDSITNNHEKLTSLYDIRFDRQEHHNIHTSCWITSSHRWRSVPLPLSSCLSYIDCVIKFWYVAKFCWNLEV